MIFNKEVFAMDIERLIFENSMLCVAMYDTLRSIDYKNNLVPAKVLARTKECYDNILNSNASEIVVTKYDVHEYGRFYSDYIELFLDKPKGFSINKSDVYLGLSESIKGVLYSLQSLLTEYSGTDTNLITAAQYALTLLKGLYSKNILDVVAKYIPKKQHVYTTVPKQLEDIINAIDAVAIVQDKKHEDYTTLNTIYTTQDINNIYDSFKSTLFTLIIIININY